MSTICYQAIETTYLPAAMNRGSRIKASCERGSLTVSYPDELSGVDCHFYAVDLLCKKFAAEDTKKYGTPDAGKHWLANRVCGGTKKGYAHVFIN